MDKAVTAMRLNGEQCYSCKVPMGTLCNRKLTFRCPLTSHQAKSQSFFPKRGRCYSEGTSGLPIWDKSHEIKIVGHMDSLWSDISNLCHLGQTYFFCRYIRGGVESNRTNFELIFLEFFELKKYFRINQIENFSNRTNWIILPTNRIEFRIFSLVRIFELFSFEWNKFRIENYQIFQTFFAFSNQSNHQFLNRIERISNYFQFDSTPSMYL